MVITFDEEFNSFSRYLDVNGNVTCNSGGTGRWQTVYQFCSRTSPANLEAEIYIDQNFIDYLNSQTTLKTAAVSPFSLNNGILTIESNPSDQAILTAAGSWAKYTSGLLTTEYSFSQLYGYFEIRAKLPVGQGLWPAFWLLPDDKSWPPEIDVLEAFGGPNQYGEGGLTSLRYASHPLDEKEGCGQWHNVGVDLTKNFHTYGVDWEPTGITYYFDDAPIGTCKSNTAASKPFFILVNLAVGGPGSWPGTPDNTNVWPARLEVDYIRAYQKK
jgi:beta-glucanase (GH16 family)